MQNHKIETNSELIYEDGSILSTLIFIKIIGSEHCDSHYHRQRSFVSIRNVKKISETKIQSVKHTSPIRPSHQILHTCILHTL